LFALVLYRIGFGFFFPLKTGLKIENFSDCVLPWLREGADRRMGGYDEHSLSFPYRMIGIPSGRKELISAI